MKAIDPNILSFWTLRNSIKKIKIRILHSNQKSEFYSVESKYSPPKAVKLLSQLILPDVNNNNNNL